MNLSYELSHELSKVEQKEVTVIENLLFDDEGRPIEDVMEKNRFKALRLRELYEKRNELYLASCN